MARYSAGIAATVAAVFAVSAFAQTPQSDDAAADAVILKAAANAQSTAARDGAARRLAGRRTAVAIDALKDALTGNNPAAQLAAARALRFVDQPDPILIAPLAALLGPSHTLTDPAARALANYPDNTEAFRSLRQHIQTGPVATRPEAVHALGCRIDKTSAEYLVGLATDPATTPAVQSAATDALIDMTGLSANGSDVNAWAQWWGQQRNLSETQFRTALLTDAHRAASAARAQAAEDIEALQTSLKETLDLVPESSKVTILVRYLRSPDAKVRAIGLGFLDKRRTERPTDPPTRAIVRGLVSDDDDAVRSSAVNFLAQLNDSDSVQVLVLQSTHERSPNVARSIADALGTISDPAAAPALLELARNPRTDIAAAAARAFGGQLGASLRKTDPAKADDASDKLRAILAGLSTASADDSFRAALVAALASLRDPRSFQLYRDLLAGDRQPVDVRRMALLGLGNLADPRANRIITEEFSAKSTAVRLAAVTALHSIVRAEDKDALYGVFDKDSDKAVRNQAWEDFKILLPSMKDIELLEWEDKVKPDPQRRIDTLTVLFDVYEKSAPFDVKANNCLNIADVWMTFDPPRPDRAVESLDRAVAYWNGHGNLPLTLIKQMVHDLCAARRYGDAVSFGQQQIGVDPGNAKLVGPELRQFADTLLHDGDKVGAKALAEEALKIGPKLDDGSRSHLEDIRNEAGQ